MTVRGIICTIKKFLSISFWGVSFDIILLNDYANTLFESSQYYMINISPFIQLKDANNIFYHVLIIFVIYYNHICHGMVTKI